MHLHRVSAGAEITPKHRARAARHVTPRHTTPVSHPNPTLSAPSLDLGSEAPAVERIGSAGSGAVPCSQRILVNRQRQPSEQRQVHAPLIPCSAVIRSRPTCRADTQAPASQGSPASPATCASIVRCLRTGSPVASPPSIANSNIGVSYMAGPGSPGLNRTL